MLSFVEYIYFILEKTLSQTSGSGKMKEEKVSGKKVPENVSGKLCQLVSEHCARQFPELWGISCFN